MSISLVGRRGPFLSIARWTLRECNRSALVPIVAGATAVCILLSPWLTPYSFGRDWHTRFEVVLAALQLGAILITVAAMRRVAMEVLSDGTAGLLLGRSLSRQTFLGATLVGSAAHIAVFLVALSAISIVPAMVHGPISDPTQAEGRQLPIGVVTWCGTLFVSACLIWLQMMVLAASGLLLSLVLPSAVVPAAMLAVFLIAHAASSATTEPAASALGAFVTLIFPSLAALTPYNHLDEKGHIALSLVPLAAAHGLGFTGVYWALSAVVFRQQEF